MQLKIAARKSDLARLQAFRVGEALRAKIPNVEIEYLFSTSLGDQNQSDPLWQMPEKGVFTEDLTKKLIAGECDAVVHSWKDLPVLDRDETMLIATLPRADVRDVILFSKAALERARQSKLLKVFSSSPRRILSIREFLTWSLPQDDSVQPWSCEFKNVRGNILTRVEKLMSGEADALVVAKAALDRLLASHEPELAEGRTKLRQHLKNCLWMIVPLSVNPGAAAQGALAIEVRRDRKDLHEIMQAISCPITWQNAHWERAELRKFGGGCQLKIGITRLTRPYGDVIFMRGETEAGERLDQNRLEPVAKTPRLSVPEGQLFPLEPDDKANRFFEREPLAVDLGALVGRDLWVAKSEALPKDAPREWHHLTWSSGITTWRKLAARGVWVSGSQDGLGEDDDTQLEIAALLGREPDFLKLSHSETQGLSRWPLLATYRLIDRDASKAPDLRGKTHFYWMSGSAFWRALQLHPEIRAARHACGPGHTYKVILQTLGRSAPVEVFLSHADWLRAYRKG